MIDINSFVTLIRIILEVLLLWFLIYTLLKSFRGSYKASLAIKGVFFIFVARWLSGVLGLLAIHAIFTSIANWIWLILILIFTPEIRTSFENIGRSNVTSLNAANQEETFFIELQETVSGLAKNKVGSLITIENSILLDSYVQTGISLKADFSRELVESIFNTKSPMHDGAIIIRDEKVLCTSVYYPINRELVLSKTLGTRHRAALSISEITDAIIIITSEETGMTSIAYMGKLYYDVDPETLTSKILEITEGGE